MKIYSPCTFRPHVFKFSLLLMLMLLACLNVAQAQKKSKAVRYAERMAKKDLKDTARSKELRKTLDDDCYCGSGPGCNSKNYYYQGSQFLSNYSMNRLIRQDITKITLSQDGSPVIGNYASLQYADNNTKITLNTSFYNPFIKDGHTESSPIKTLLSVNVKAAISDGVSSIFANKNATSGTSVTLRYSFLSPRTVYERYNAPVCNDLKFNRTRLLQNYDLQKQNWRALPNIKRQPLQDKVDKAQKALSAFDASWIKEQRQVREDSLQIKVLDIAKEKAGLPDVLTNAYADIDKDKLRSQSEKNALKVLVKETKERDLELREKAANDAFNKLHNTKPSEIDKLRRILVANYTATLTDLNTFETTVGRYDAGAAIDSTYALLYAMEAKDVKWDYYKLKWFDIDASIGGNKYQMFDNTLDVGKQLFSQPFTSWSAGFSFNYFESGDAAKIFRKGYFLQWGFHVSNTNNLIGASTLDVSTTDSYGDATKKVTATDKKTAYVAPFVKSYLRSFGFRFSAYQDDKHSSSLNFYNTTSFPFTSGFYKINQKPDVLLGTGYTMAFLNKDKAKAILNVELFLNFADILNYNAADTKFYQRHELGLRVGVPFNSIFINK